MKYTSYTWRDCEVSFIDFVPGKSGLTYKLDGLTSVEITTSEDSEAVYAIGQHPKYIGVGNRSNIAKFSILHRDYENLLLFIQNDAGDGFTPNTENTADSDDARRKTLQDLSEKTQIVINFNGKDSVDRKTRSSSYTLIDCHFNPGPIIYNQNDKSSSIDLEVKYLESKTNILAN